jgi:glutamate-1-semialdehyde 2,1-aminomutase
MAGYAQILKEAPVKAVALGDAPMFDIVFTDREVRDYRSALGDEAMMKRCNALLRDRGILKSEGKYYISTAHTDEDVRATLDAFANAIDGLRVPSAA